MSTNPNISKNINYNRQKTVCHTFQESIGERVLILTEEFPFLLIGTIENVDGDFVYIYVETTHIDPLEDRLFRVHIDAIEVFYIESPERPIPKLSENDEGSTNWGDR